MTSIGTYKLRGVQPFVRTLTTVRRAFLLATLLGASSVGCAAAATNGDDTPTIDGAQDRVALTVESLTPASGSADCTATGIQLSVGKDGLHLFMCGTITFSCPDGTTKTQVNAFGAAGASDQKLCEAGFPTVVPVKDDIQKGCDKNPLACLDTLNRVSSDRSDPGVCRLFFSPVLGAPCRLAVVEITDELRDRGRAE